MSMASRRRPPMVHEARLEHMAEYAVEKAEQVVTPLKAPRLTVQPIDV